MVEMGHGGGGDLSVGAGSAGMERVANVAIRSVIDDVELPWRE